MLFRWYSWDERRQRNALLSSYYPSKKARLVLRYQIPSQRCIAVWASRKRKNFHYKSISKIIWVHFLWSFSGFNYEQIRRLIWKSTPKDFSVGKRNCSFDHFYWWNWFNADCKNIKRYWFSEENQNWVPCSIWPTRRPSHCHRSNKFAKWIRSCSSQEIQ